MANPLRSTINLWAIYSDDDGVELCDSKLAAQRTIRAWEKAGANGVDGPFGPFPVELAEFIKPQAKRAFERTESAPDVNARSARYVSPDRTEASDYPYCAKCERTIRDKEYQANADGTFQHLNACEVSR